MNSCAGNIASYVHKMKRRYEIIAISLGVLFIILFTSLLWNGPQAQSIAKDISMIYILIWTPTLIEPLHSIFRGQTGFKERRCPVNNCYVTANRNLLKDLTDYDVIIFHFPEINLETSYLDMPEKRSPQQIYVFVCIESSKYYPAPNNIYYDSYFNMTWSYKLNSDVYFGYVTIKNRSGEVIGPSENIKWLKFDEMLPINETLKEKLKKKHKAGAWFVTNCNAPNGRNGLMDELQTILKEYNISVDVYGRCATKKCPKNRMLDCLNSIKNEYYFYFSLENSFSTDYVTEKLLTALNNFAVPVVFGGADYKRFMPDGIYLDARNLTRKELAEQIMLAMNDVDKYYDYFKWHNHYSYHNLEDSPKTDPYCNLCDYVNKWNGTKVVQDLKHWWNE